MYKRNKELKNNILDTKSNKMIEVKQGLLEIINKYHPNYFFTIQLPSKRRTYDELKFRPKLKDILSSFEWKLIGRHWNTDPLPFICFMEKGISGYWHAHILFDLEQYALEKIEDTLKKVRRTKKLPRSTFKLEKITSHSTEVKSGFNTGVELYCVKEIKPDLYGRFDSDRMIFSCNLFDVKETIRDNPSKERKKNNEN